MNITISIIVPTLHRKTSVLRLLGSLSSELDKKTTEIIIVEQGDNNESTYRKFVANEALSIRYFFLDDHNTAKAKNLGAKHAVGKYYIFYDDDVAVHKDAIKNMINNFQDSHVGAVGGRVITPGQQIEPNRSDVGRLSSWGAFSDGFSSNIRQNIDTLIGCNMGFRADVFRSIQGFDEQFTGAIREDSDLSLRVKRLGYNVIFDPSAVVTHLREPTGGGRKSEGRLAWNFHFFSNETYFFLKHCRKVYFPLFLVMKTEWALRCMFGFGREVSLRSMITPAAGIIDGIQKYRNLQKSYAYWR